MASSRPRSPGEEAGDRLAVPQDPLREEPRDAKTAGASREDISAKVDPSRSPSPGIRRSHQLPTQGESTTAEPDPHRPRGPQPSRSNTGASQRDPSTPILSFVGNLPWRKSAKLAPETVQSPTSASPAPKPGGSSAVNKITKDQGQGKEKASEKSKTEGGKPGVKTQPPNPPERPRLVELVNHCPGEKPALNIIAVPDLGQTPATAWSFVTEKGFERRPEQEAKESQRTHPIPPSSTSRPDAAALNTETKVRNETQLRKRREERIRDIVDNWKLETSDINESSGDQITEVQVASKAEAMASFPGKGKERADEVGDAAVERGRRLLVPQPVVEAASDNGSVRNVHDDDRNSRHSNRPSSTKGSKGPSERDKTAKAGNWLADPTMLGSDFNQARVWALAYRPLDPGQTALDKNTPPKLDYAKYLEDVARALVEPLLENNQRNLFSSRPLIFVGVGFGCLVIQKAYCLLAEDSPHSPYRWWVFAATAGSLFFDAPDPVVPKDYPKKPKSSFYNGKVITELPPIFPPVSNPTNPRIARVRNIVEPKTLDAWGLWLEFRGLLQKWATPIVWFYTAPSNSTTKSPTPYTPYVDFSKLEPVPRKPTPANSVPLSGSRSAWRFRGPGDPNYRSFVRHVKRLLVFVASSVVRFERQLATFIDWKYELDVKDWIGDSPLHCAMRRMNDSAAMRLLSASPQLATTRDTNSATPLHILFNEIVAVDSQLGTKMDGFRMVIQKILGLPGMDNRENLLDGQGKTPWECIPDDGPEPDWPYDWLWELRKHRELPKGARAGRFRTTEDLIEELAGWGGYEMHACESARVDLIQFYIAQDEHQDYLDPQRPTVYTALYNPAYGTEQLFQRSLLLDEDKRPTCRWIHLPANNEKWVQALFLRQFGRIDESIGKRRHRGLSYFDQHMAPGAIRYSQVFEPKLREWAPLLRLRFAMVRYGDPPIPLEIPPELGPGKRTVTALFIPVFGFELHRYRRLLTQTMKAFPNFATADINENTGLIQNFYRGGRESPLHCRRTLDQFTYHMLQDTERRDNSQVMSRWARTNGRKDGKDGNAQLDERRISKDDCPVLMVDQLWLWVLEDDKTVITSLPNTWCPDEKYNLARYLAEEKLEGNDERPLIKDTLDLANTIIRYSVDFLNRPGPGEVTLYECFQSSITLIAERQAIQLDEFKSLVRNLNKNTLDEQTRATETNALFQLTTETRLLAEIMDILDELKTIQNVFKEQRTALIKWIKVLFPNRLSFATEAYYSLSSPYRDSSGRTDDDSDIVGTPESSMYNDRTSAGFYDEPDHFDAAGMSSPRRPLASAMSGGGLGSPTARARAGGRRTVQFADESAMFQKPRALTQAEETLELVQANMSTIKEMMVYAEKVRQEINGLISHRQKQANAWEARFAREGSEHTQRQSNITLVFTTVTVIFLPLSFLSSVLAISIERYPHNAETGEVNWPLHEVMGLIFGISFGTIIIIVTLAFYSNRIVRWYRSRAVRVPVRVRPRRRRHRRHPSDADSDGGSGSDSGDGSAGTRSEHFIEEPTSETEWKTCSSWTEPLYARLFDRYTFHWRIPWIRDLWRLHHYPPILPKTAAAPWSPKEVDWEAGGTGGGPYPDFENEGSPPGDEAAIGDAEPVHDRQQGPDFSILHVSVDHDAHGGSSSDVDAITTGWGGNEDGVDELGSIHEGWETYPENMVDAADNFVWDYPLHRAWLRVKEPTIGEAGVLRPLVDAFGSVAIMPEWAKTVVGLATLRGSREARKNKKQDKKRRQEEEEEAAAQARRRDEEKAENASVRSSMERSTVQGSEDSWHVPSTSSIRRRRSVARVAEKDANKSRLAVPEFLPWPRQRTGETTKSGRRESFTLAAQERRPSFISRQDSIRSARSSLDASLNTEEEDSADGRSNEGRGKKPGLTLGLGLGKGTGMNIPLPSFSRKKVKEEHLESGLGGAESRARGGEGIDR